MPLIPKKAWAGYVQDGKFRMKIRHRHMTGLARRRLLRLSQAEEPRQAVFLNGQWKWLNNFWGRT